MSAWIEINKKQPPFGSCLVALPVSAWIEIATEWASVPSFACRTPRECVDWNKNGDYVKYKDGRRTPRECVDWNSKKSTVAAVMATSRTPRECVDWNKNLKRRNWDWNCRTPRECVDWNYFLLFTSQTPTPVALPVSAWIEMNLLLLKDNSFQVALPVSAWIEIEKSS